MNNITERLLDLARRGGTVRLEHDGGMPTARLEGPDGPNLHAWGTDLEDAAARLLALAEATP